MWQLTDNDEFEKLHSSNKSNFYHIYNPVMGFTLKSSMCHKMNEWEKGDWSSICLLFFVFIYSRKKIRVHLRKKGKNP